MSEVALPAVINGTAGGYVAIVPPRNLDPSPDVATSAILDTAQTQWSKAVAIGTAQRTITPSERGPLQVPRSSPGLSPAIVSASVRVTQDIPALDTTVNTGP